MDIVKSTRGIEMNALGEVHGRDPAGRLTPLHIIWHRRVIVLLTIVACGLGAYILSLLMPKVYTRTSQIVIEPVSVKALGDGLNMESYLNTQVELINKSTAIHADALNGLVEEHGLVAMRTFIGKEKMAVLRQNLTATAGKSDYSITVSYNSQYADEGAYVVNAVVDAYRSFTSDDKHKTNEVNIKDVQADQEKRHQEMKDQQQKRALLMGEISVLQANESTGNVEMEGLRKLSEALNGARLESINAQAAFEDYAKGAFGDAAKLDKLLRTGEVNGVVVVPGRDGDQIRSEMYAAQARLNDLRERYLPNHPAVQTSQQKVDGLSAAYVMFLHQQWDSASKKLQRFEQSYEELERRVAVRAKEVTQKLAEKTAALDEVSRDLERNTKLLSGLDQKAQDLTSMDRAAPMRISVVDRADPDAKVDPAKPRKSIMLIEGLMVGFILGITLAFVDQRVRSIDEVVAATSLPILGVVPHMARGLSLQSRGRKVHLDPMSDVAEAYRAVRTSVFFGSKGKTILVTSAMRAEGKSTLAANLAISIAETGQRVLLLDADLREPMQHRIFAANNDAGLSSVVAGRVSVERATQSTGIRGLELMPCGPVPFNPSEAINNQTFADLLSDLSAKYDYVVVDSPPVMAVTDARILGAMCDVTLMVVRAERSNRRATGDARDGLMGFGANVLGVVINDGPRNRHRYGYYAGYGSRNQRPGNGNGGSARSGERPAMTGTDFMIAAQKR